MSGRENRLKIVDFFLKNVLCKLKKTPGIIHLEAAVGTVLEIAATFPMAKIATEGLFTIKNWFFT